jgi:light-regulated signal transduction histidine kinase (bacteriophytochrome)
MEDQSGKMCANGLVLFSKTNRLISHELKNILAIISETLSLIDELTQISDTALTPERLRSLRESMMEEVQRANQIIRNMNAFAHTVDDFIGEVDVGGTLALMIAFSKLDSSLAKTKVHLVDNEPCNLHTSQFFLANLIYNVLIFCLHNGGANKEIQSSFDSKDNRVWITFSGMDIRASDEFPTRKEKRLAAALSAEISIDRNAGVVTIHLPVRLDESDLNKLASHP